MGLTTVSSRSCVRLGASHRIFRHRQSTHLQTNLSLHFLRSACLYSSDSNKVSSTSPSSEPSGSTADPTTVDDIEKLRAAPAVKHVPKAVFPWRHETWENPLPRMVPGSPESEYNIHLAPSGRNFVGHMFLGIPWLRSIFTDWQGDLAEACSFAFAQGVAGIVSNVYRVPLEAIDKNETEGKIEFRFPFHVTEEGDTTATSPEPEDDKPATNETDEKSEIPAPDSDTKPSSNLTTNEQGDEAFCPEIGEMLDLPLRNLYKSAHESGKHQLEIRLEMEPKRALVYELFCAPFFSRKATENDPSIGEKLRQIMTTMPSDPGGGFQILYSYLLEQVEAKDQLETTVEAQILIDCDEVFQVHCKETGALLQGSNDGKVRSVLHLVRLENTVTTVFGDNFPYFPSTTLGNWIITDIDDLLGPKKWYHK